MNLEKKFEKYFSTYSLNRNSKIAVAVSGGVDSLSLALLLKRNHQNLIALIINHGIRTESPLECMKTKEWLKKNNIQSKIIKITAPCPESNIMAWARNERYEALSNYCHKNGIIHLFVGHHENDNKENLALDMKEIKEISSINKIRVYRPLLNCKKQELYDYLRKLKQDWIEDPSNINMKYARGKIRVHGLSSSKKNGLEKIYNISILPIGVASFKIENNNRELLKNSLQKILPVISGKELPVRSAKIEILTDSLSNNVNKINNLNHCVIIKRDNFIFIGKDKKYCDEEIHLNKKQDLNWDNRFKIKAKKNISILPYYKTNFSKYKSLPKRILNSIPVIKHKNNYYEIENTDLAEVIFTPPKSLTYMT